MASKGKKLIRDLFTGELKEVPCSTDSGRATYLHDGEKVVEGTPEARKNVSAWTNPWKSRALGVPKHQEASMNRKIRQAGITGVEYKDSHCFAESRSARNAALAFHGKGDADAGYGDRPPANG